jgi:hypothetical protein
VRLIPWGVSLAKTLSEKKWAGVGGNNSVRAEWTEEQGPWLCRVKLLSLCD